MLRLANYAAIIGRPLAETGRYSEIACSCIASASNNPRSISIEQAVSKTIFYDILKLLEFPTHDVNILISLNFVHTYMEMSTTVKNPDCSSFSFMLQGTPVNDPVFKKRGILARVYEASYRFLFFLLLSAKMGTKIVRVTTGAQRKTPPAQRIVSSSYSCWCPTV